MRRQPEKSVGSITGRGLEACNGTTFGVSANNCELRTGNAVWGCVGGEPGKQKAQESCSGTWILLRKWRCEPPTLGSSSLPRTPSPSPSAWPSPVACLPTFPNSGFHHRNLPLLLSQILPPCQQVGALPGNLPGLESRSQTPAASKHGRYPTAVLSPTLPSFPSMKGSTHNPSPCFQGAAQTPPWASPHVPALADHQNSPRPHLPFFSPAGAVHYQGTKNPI